jgi:hypothetical protein
MKFEVGKKYTGKNNDNKTFVIQITNNRQKDVEGEMINRYSYETLKGNTNFSSAGFDDGSIFADRLKPYEDLPRICYVLGGEDTPLKIGKLFKFYSFFYYISGKGIVVRLDGEDAFIDSVCEMINHPEKIIRRPQFEDDEKSFMRHCVNEGYPIFFRLAAGNLRMSNDASEWFTLPNNLLPHLTNEMSPFDAENYLESEGKNDG